MTDCTHSMNKRRRVTRLPKYLIIEPKKYKFVNAVKSADEYKFLRDTINCDSFSTISTNEIFEDYFCYCDDEYLMKDLPTNLLVLPFLDDYTATQQKYLGGPRGTFILVPETTRSHDRTKLQRAIQDFCDNSDNYEEQDYYLGPLKKALNECEK